jgi:hypothetical protein
MPLYTNDPNNTKKQVPDVTPNGTSRFSFATCPSSETITKRPSYVIVNTDGEYAFAYESGSVSTYITGSSMQSANAGGIRLDINPVAWRRTDDTDAVGQITFVYVRVS